MNAGLCQWCFREAKFARAHIIPKAFYSISSKETLKLLSGKAGSHSKRRPIGTYDEGLICEGCEQDYSYLDDYAARVLKPWPRRSQFIRDEQGFIIRSEPNKRGSYGGYYVTKPDAIKLTLFFHFLLWRMAKTSRPEMKLNLSELLTSRLRDNVLKREPDDLGFKIYAMRFRDRAAAQAVFNPRVRTVDDRTTININFFGFEFYFVSDDNHEMKEFALSHGSNWPVLFADFHQSKLYDPVRSMLLRNSDEFSRQNAKREKLRA